MAKRSKPTSVGEELVTRMRTFTESLKGVRQLSERFTVRTVKLQIRPAKYDAAKVREIRQRLQASQAIFAQFLGVSLSAVRDWEQGLKPPSGAASRLMDEIDNNPGYFLDRLRQLSEPIRA